MKLAIVNPRPDFDMDDIFAKEVSHWFVYAYMKNKTLKAIYRWAKIRHVDSKPGCLNSNDCGAISWNGSFRLFSWDGSLWLF